MRGGRSESQVRGGAHVIGDTSIVLPFGVVLTQVHWQLREDGIAVDVVDPEERHRVEIDRERRGEHETREEPLLLLLGHWRQRQL